MDGIKKLGLVGEIADGNPLPAILPACQPDGFYLEPSGGSGLGLLLATGVASFSEMPRSTLSSLPIFVLLANSQYLLTNPNAMQCNASVACVRRQGRRIRHCWVVTVALRGKRRPFSSLTMDKARTDRLTD